MVNEKQGLETRKELNLKMKTLQQLLCNHHVQESICVNATQYDPRQCSYNEGVWLTPYSQLLKGNTYEMSPFPTLMQVYAHSIAISF